MFTVYQLVVAFKKNADERVIFEKIGILFFIYSVFNAQVIKKKKIY